MVIEVVGWGQLLETALEDMLVGFSKSLMAAHYLDITLPFSQTLFPPISPQNVTKFLELQDPMELNYILSKAPGRG